MVIRAQVTKTIAGICKGQRIGSLDGQERFSSLKERDGIRYKSGKGTLEGTFCEPWASAGQPFSRGSLVPFADWRQTFRGLNPVGYFMPHVESSRLNSLQMPWHKVDWPE